MSIGTLSRRSVSLIVAVLLAALATATWMSYVRSLEHKAVSGAQTVRVLVAKDLIPVGTTAETAAQRGLFVTQDIPRKLVADGALSVADTLRGAVAGSTIAKGEQIVRGRFVSAQEVGRLLNIPADHQAISVQVDAPRAVGGFVQPHDHVSVIAKLDTPQGPRAQFIFQNIEVLAVGTQVSPRTPASSSSANAKTQPDVVSDRVVMTLSLTAPQSEQMALASTNGVVIFTLLPPGAKPATTTGRTNQNFFN